jgi:hypothetical protein
MTKYRELHLDKNAKNKLYIWGSIYQSYAGVINKEDTKQYNEIYNKFKDNKLKLNSFVNISSLSEFPSYKLKNYINENNLNITITRKIEKIDTIILNNSFINQSYLNPSEKNINLYYCIPYSYIIDNYKKYDTDEYYNLAKNPTEYYLIEINKLYEFINIDNKFSSLSEFPIIEGVLISSGHGSKKASENIDFFKNLTKYIEENNLDVVFDESISNEINKESIIDLEVFKILFSMLSSEDINNHTIAQELISNHDFESSKPYILFLATIFKTLRNKSSNNKNWGITYKQIIEYKSLIATYWTSHSDAIDNVDYFIKNFTTKYPQYKQTICDCMVVYLNYRFKIDLIKEIHSL